MTKEKQIDGMVEACEVTITINCTKCDAVTGEWCMDEHDAAAIFYKKGWRMGRYNVYCPACAKKHLKQQKEKA